MVAAFELIQEENKIVWGANNVNLVVPVSHFRCYAYCSFISIIINVVRTQSLLVGVPFSVLLLRQSLLVDIKKFRQCLSLCR